MTTPVYKYFRLAPDENARVALAFSGGDPAIVEASIHQGCSILVATEGSLSSVDAAGNYWTTLPIWPSFVPLVQEMLALAVRGRMAEHNLAVGQPLGEWLDAVATRPEVFVTTPSAQRDEVRMALDQQTSRWSFGDTSQSGVYRVEIGARCRATKPTPSTSTRPKATWRRISPEELPREFSTHGRASADESGVPAIAQRSGLHKSLLYIVLGLLFVETILAWRFGRASS